MREMSLEQLAQYRESLRKSCLDMRLLIDSCQKENDHLRSANTFLDEYSRKLAELREQASSSTWEVVWAKGEQGVNFIRRTGLPAKLTAALSSLPSIHSIVLQPKVKGLFSGVGQGLYKGYEKSKAWVGSAWWSRSQPQAQAQPQQQPCQPQPETDLKTK